MASIIKIKRSTTASSVPNSLAEGELAVNLFDRKLYVGNSAGVTAVSGENYTLATSAATAGEGAYITLSGDQGTSQTVTIVPGTDIDVNRNANGAIGISLEGTIGSDTTGNAATATALATGRTISLTGDVTYTSGSFNGTGNVTGAATLATSAGSTLANYLQVANSTVFATSATVASNLANTNAYIADTYTYASSKLGGTATVTLTGDVTGTASFSGNTVSISTTYNNDVVLGTDTSGNYAAAVTGTTNEIEVSGSAGEGTTFQIGLPNDVTIGNDLTVTNDLGVQGNVTIDGNLTVEGGVTYISSSTVNVDDTMIKLSANNAGNSVDHGVYAKYVDGATTKYAGYFRDVSDSSIFKFYTGLQTEPGTTVDTGATGYTLAQLDAVIDGGTY